MKPRCCTWQGQRSATDADARQTAEQARSADAASTYPFTHGVIPVADLAQQLRQESLVQVQALRTAATERRLHAVSVRVSTCVDRLARWRADLLRVVLVQMDPSCSQLVDGGRLDARARVAVVPKTMIINDNKHDVRTAAIRGRGHDCTAHQERIRRQHRHFDEATPLRNVRVPVLVYSCSSTVCTLCIRSSY